MFKRFSRFKNLQHIDSTFKAFFTSREFELHQFGVKFIHRTIQNKQTVLKINVSKDRACMLNEALDTKCSADLDVKNSFKISIPFRSVPPAVCSLLRS